MPAVPRPPKITTLQDGSQIHTKKILRATVLHARREHVGAVWRAYIRPIDGAEKIEWLVERADLIEVIYDAYHRTRSQIGAGKLERKTAVRPTKEQARLIELARKKRERVAAKRRWI